MPEGLMEFADRNESELSLQEANQRLAAQLREAKNREKRLVEATLTAARDAQLALGPYEPVPRPSKDSRTKGEEVAIWHLTDWQGAKVTTSYNSQVMRERVMRYCEKARKITDIMRADHPVKKCLILFGGDMGEGLFNFPQQPFEIDATIFDQFVKVGRLEIDVIRFALSIYDEVEVKAEWGNHGRIGSKRSAVPKSDNFDRMTYELARLLLTEDGAGRPTEPRLRWEENSAEDEQRVEVGEYRALLIHGDEVGRNGYASPATIVQHVANWKSGAYPWDFQDCYVGHYHNHSSYALPDGDGQVYFTGSPESDNRYARTSMASAGAPTQRLHFVDPLAGIVTYESKIWLDR